MILAVNAICLREPEYIGQDYHLVGIALKVMDSVIADTGSDSVRSYREICTELLDGARRTGAFVQ